MKIEIIINNGGECDYGDGINPAPGVTREEELERLRHRREYEQRRDNERVSDDWVPWKDWTGQIY